MVRLILTDMDGTLLDSQSRLPEGFDAMMAELKRRGVMFGAASGRQYYSLIESFAKYKDEFLFVAENGTNVRYRGEQVFSCPMDRDVALEILSKVYAADPGIFCMPRLSACGFDVQFIITGERLKPVPEENELLQRFRELSLKGKSSIFMTLDALERLAPNLKKTLKDKWRNNFGE